MNSSDSFAIFCPIPEDAIRMIWMGKPIKKQKTRQRIKFPVDYDNPGQLRLLVHTLWNDIIGPVDASHRHSCHEVLIMKNTTTKKESGARLC